VQFGRHTAGPIETDGSHIGNFGISFYRGSGFTSMKQTLAQLLQKFPAFYYVRRIIIVFTRVCHWGTSPEPVAFSRVTLKILLRILPSASRS